MTITCRCGLPAAFSGEGEGTTLGGFDPPGHSHDRNRYSGLWRCPAGHGTMAPDGQWFSKACPVCGWRREEMGGRALLALPLPAR